LEDASLPNESAVADAARTAVTDINPTDSNAFVVRAQVLTDAYGTERADASSHDVRATTPLAEVGVIDAAGR
jgi:hypothetical protein